MVIKVKMILVMIVIAGSGFYDNDNGSEGVDDNGDEEVHDDDNEEDDDDDGNDERPDPRRREVLSM